MPWQIDLINQAMTNFADGIVDLRLNATIAPGAYRRHQRALRLRTPKCYTLRMRRRFTGVKWAPSSTLHEPRCYWGTSMHCSVMASLRCTTPAPRSHMSARKTARNGNLHSRMQFSPMQRQPQRTLKFIRATMHWRRQWVEVCQTLRSARYLRRRLVMFQRRQRRDKRPRPDKELVERTRRYEPGSPTTQTARRSTSLVRRLSA